MVAQPMAGSAVVSFSDRLGEERRPRYPEGNPRKLGFNVISYVSSNLGMGVTARHYIHLLLDQGHEVSVLDMEKLSAQGWSDRTYADITVACARDLPHAINLFALDISVLP